MQFPEFVRVGGVALLVLLSACAGSAPVEEAAPTVAPAPDELALVETSEGSTGPLTEADLPDGVDPDPSAEELAAEAAETRPDVEPGVLALENADHSFEARLVDGTLTGATGVLEVELGSMVAFGLVTDVTDSLVIDDLDLSVATNGDAAQLVFVADMPGVFPVRLRSTGELIAELSVS